MLAQSEHLGINGIWKKCKQTTLASFITSPESCGCVIVRLLECDNHRHIAALPKLTLILILTNANHIHHFS